MPYLSEKREWKHFLIYFDGTIKYFITADLNKVYDIIVTINVQA